MPNRLVTGAVIKVLINGQDIGFVHSFNYQMAEPADEERGIDSMSPFEISPTVTSVSGSVGVFAIRGSSILEETNITPGIKFLPEGKYITIELKERDTDRLVFKAMECKIEGQQWSVQTRAIVAGTFTFKGTMAETSFTQF